MHHTDLLTFDVVTYICVRQNEHLIPIDKLLDKYTDITIKGV